MYIGVSKTIQTAACRQRECNHSTSDSYMFKVIYFLTTSLNLKELVHFGRETEPKTSNELCRPLLEHNFFKKLYFKVQKWFTKLCILSQNNTAYSPDLAPSDFWLFPYLNINYVVADKIL